MTAESICGILKGDKTETRRVIRPQPPQDHTGYMMNVLTPTWEFWVPGTYPWGCIEVRCPFGQEGDLLWVRESFQVGYKIRGKTFSLLPPTGSSERDGKVIYRAGFKEPDPEKHGRIPWRPAMLMPRWASRLTLKIVRVLPQYLKGISVKEIKAEGVRIPRTAGGIGIRLTGDHPPIQYLPKSLKHGDDWTAEQLMGAHFASGWDSLNEARGFGWDKNPRVWAISFRRVA